MFVCSAGGMLKDNNLIFKIKYQKNTRKFLRKKALKSLNYYCKLQLKNTITLTRIYIIIID